VLTALAGVLCAAIAVWCAVHTVHEMSTDRGTGRYVCVTIDPSMNAIPLHHTLALGVLTGGCAIVAGMQTIRWVNAARSGD
jgi:hypothetical protein